MNRLFLFNPENDIALASGLGRITPPRQAALLHEAGALLPFWLAGEGDFLLVGEGHAGRCNEWLRSNSMDGVVAVESAKGLCVDSLSPWGWSLDAIDQFRRAGVDDTLLMPMAEKMEKHRELSHRRSGLRLLGMLESEGLRPEGCMVAEVSDVNEIAGYAQRSGRLFIKSPWSSSGRGVFPVDASSLAKSAGRIEGIIRHQGSVMVEVALDRVLDFAMLFDLSGGRTTFAGYSVFRNSTLTNYGGNLVGPDEYLSDYISQYVDRVMLERVRDAVEAAMGRLLGDDYNGPVGVDMMVYRRKSNDECAVEAGRNTVSANMIAPCIEINLRHTMGFVARGIWRKCKRIGEMSIAPTGGNACLDGEVVRLAPENLYFDFLFRSGGQV